MRKWMVVLIGFILVFAFIYGFIPGKVNIHQRVIVTANPKAFSRQILDEQTWRQWWPDKQSTASGSNFEYKGNQYHFVEKKLSSIVIAINKNKDSVLTELVFIPIPNDSIELSWGGRGKTSLNPVSRIQNFSWIKSVSADVQYLLKAMQPFYSNENNLYGLSIKKDHVADSNLISTSAISKTYPTAGFIYGLIDKLRSYIQKNGGTELDSPMLNLYKKEDGTYLTRVAIPVDKKLKDSGNIQYRWMFKGGNILIAEVKGGPYQIQGAFGKMENYIQDHQRVSPAIPFQSLVTDRRLEPDTNKWITRLYWPVM